MRIFMIGFMGCGKTHWGRQIAEKLQVPFFDLDATIIEQEGKPINEIFEQEGEEYFRLLEKDILHLLTESHESFVMATGGGTPCYYKNIDYMNQEGSTVWINCSVECLFNRLVKEKSGRPLIRDLSDEQLRSFIIRKFGDRKIYYQQASVILNSDDFRLEEIMERIIQQQ